MNPSRTHFMTTERTVTNRCYASRAVRNIYRHGTDDNRSLRRTTFVIEKSRNKYTVYDILID